MGQKLYFMEKNRGLIAATSNGNEVIIRAKILKDGLRFSFGGSTVTAKMIEKGCKAEFERTKENTFEKRTFDGMKHVIRHLVGNDELVFDAGILSLAEHSFSFVVVQNGFLLHLEIMPAKIISFGVVHQGKEILLAKQEGEWNVKQSGQEVIAECSNYYEALDIIMKEVNLSFMETAKEYSEKNMVH